MKAAMVTFIGGKGAEGVNPYVWGSVTFPLGKAVEIDPDKEPNRDRKAFLQHVMRKVPTNRFFSVVEIPPPALPEPEKPVEKPEDEQKAPAAKRKGGRKKKVVTEAEAA